MDILLMDIGDYFKLNYHRFGGYQWILVVILLVAIIGYFIVGHWWL